MRSKEPKGIGGWLLFPTIFLFLLAISSSLGVIYAIIDSTSYIYEDPFIALTTIFSVTIAVLAIYSLVLEFKKKEEFPKLASMTIFCHLVVVYVLGHILFDYSKYAYLPRVIVYGIMMVYLQKSKRVKNTFVE